MTPAEIQAALSAPFKQSELGVKPQTVSGNRALAVWYVDARAVMNRLDAVLGPTGWQTSYREFKEGVVCTLRVCIQGEWVSHEDVGGESDQRDEGDRLKSAFSDALKRAAVHVGIGRYLYELPLVWADYDPQRKQFVREPALPAWALPGGEPVRQAPASQSQSAPPKPAAKPLTPENAARLEQLKARDQELNRAGLCAEFDLLKAASKAAKATGAGGKAETWDEKAWQAALDAAQSFEQDCAARAPACEEEREAIDAMLLAKGETLQRLMDKLGLRDPAKLTSAQAEEALTLLRGLPDVSEKKTRARK